jgi:nucleoside 2-deoxyribosyltransferase
MGGEWREKAWVLAGATRNHWVANRVPTMLTTASIPQLIEDAPLPKSPFEVMDRILLDLIYLQRHDGGFAEPFQIATDRHTLYYLPTVEDLKWVLRGMEVLGYGVNFRDQRPHSQLFLIELTMQGWQYARGLERSTVDSWQAFVAMHFTSELAPAFDEGIKPALIETGYAPMRVDRAQHNQKIDDYIVAELRRSGLVVADFTGHRGGVYFECGYAMGRGTPVIWCCRESDLAGAHFDTRQYNHIVWSTAADLREALTDRIRSTLPFRERRKRD